MKLSLVIPCYNEESTIAEVVSSVLALASSSLEIEAVVVDDCSVDKSRMVVEEIARADSRVKVVAHDRNCGKGASLKTGFLEATGDFVGVQDADDEYDPRDYLRLLRPLVEGRADVVYGSRYVSNGERYVLRHWHSWVNRFLTMCSNVCSDMSVSDMETCYKLFRRDVIASIAPILREGRFGFEPEVTAIVARGMRKWGWRVVECPISYKPRSFREGKKIGWKDGVRALWCIVKYNFISRSKLKEGGGK